MTTPTARAGLPPGLHWRSVDEEIHLGYRRGKRAGRWLVRWRQDGGYKQAKLGPADDVVKVGTLDFNGAVRAAKAHVENARAEAASMLAGAPYLVRHAVWEYVCNRNARESRRTAREKRSDADHRLSRYVLGQPARGRQAAVPAAPIADVALARLTESDLRNWRMNLPGHLAATTKRRSINDLRAALNSGFTEHREALPATLPATIKYGLRPEAAEDNSEAVARENHILTDAQIAALVSAAREVDIEEGWDGGLFRIVLALAATGARFSQLVRMRVGDVQPSERRLLVPASRKGRGRVDRLTPVPVGDDVLEALSPIVNRPENDILFLRPRWTPEKRGIGWKRDGVDPWKTSSEITRPWAKIAGRAGLPIAIPYALRHSSIVRGIRVGLPIRLVAAQHDTSVQMIERHYARWISDGLQDLARAAIVPLIGGVASDE